MCESEHFVQFYEDDAFLEESLASYIGAGFAVGDSAIVIATRQHTENLEKKLEEYGFAIGQLKTHAQFVRLDAEETLEKFMVNGLPDRELFMQSVGQLVGRTKRSGYRLRAFGEMVALLWAQENRDGAIRLEELWNDLGKATSFSLFCAYPMTDLSGESNSEPFMDICRAHSRVIPAESYAAQPDAFERLRSISVLQQKAASLQTEIAERKQAETAVREQQIKFALAERLARLGTWELDLTTSEISTSEQCNELLGLDPNDSLDYERLLERIHPEDRSEVRCTFQKATATATEFKTEFRITNSDGDSRWILAQGRCFQTGSKRIFGIVQELTNQRERSKTATFS